MPFVVLLVVVIFGFTVPDDYADVKAVQQNESLPNSLFLKEFNYDKHATNPIIRLHNKRDSFFCSGVVVDTTHAVTAAHCVVDSFDSLDTTQITVKDNNQNFITYATAEAIDLDKDSAIIRGNFTNVQSAWSDFTGEVVPMPGEILTACGYPTGQKEIYCAKVVFTGNYLFKLAGSGVPLIKGMSGGPVLYNNRVIGVNSEVSYTNTLFGPIVGLQELAVEY